MTTQTDKYLALCAINAAANLFNRLAEQAGRHAARAAVGPRGRFDSHRELADTYALEAGAAYLEWTALRRELATVAEVS